MDNQKTWKAFYQAAIAFRDLQPWKWMHDSDIFGVQHPETGEIGYCCVMGNAGEVFALGVYPGDEGFKSYLALTEMPEELPFSDQAALGLNQKVLKVEFVDREEMTEPDRKQVKEAGVKFRGRNQWVQARNHEPGFLPWYITPEQAQFLTYALEQAVDVAQRFREDEDILYKKEGHMLVRKPVNKEGEWQWKDSYQKVRSYTIAPFPAIVPSPARVEAARKELEQKPTALLFVLQYMHNPIQESDYDRPIMPKIAVWLDYGSGMILHFQLIGPGDYSDEVEQGIFDQFHKLGFLPRQIGVNSVMAYHALLRTAEALDIELLFIPEEPAFEEVGEMLRGMM